MEMKWNGDGDENEMDELKWRMRWSEYGKREREFFLENIECRVPLIFTLFFLYKTANSRLVFRIIQEFIFYLFFN